MATVFSVHGTWAHNSKADTANAGATPKEKHWWETGGQFENELKQWVVGEDGQLEFESFVWDGENSEQSRRKAGKRLLEKTSELEAKQEPYALVGHSHGGSVISATLLEAVAKRKPTEHLSRWLTVGTPFVSLKKETFLFTRVPLVLQAIYVALVLFMVMFLLPMLLGLFAGEDDRGRYMGGFGSVDFSSVDGIATLALTTLVVSSVFILFYIFLYIMDRRILHMHAPRNIAKAKERFDKKWVGLSHEDDEAVQGLRSLNTVDFSIFDKSFFVPFFTAVAIFALPLAYLIVISTPSTMVGIAEYLKTNVYHYDASKALVADAKTLRDDVRALRKKMRGSGLTMQGCLDGTHKGKPSAGVTEAEAARICAGWKNARRTLRKLRKEQPNLPRALRFEAAYLNSETGQLQGNGYDTRINSWMIYNLINDGINDTLKLDRIGIKRVDGQRLTKSQRQTRQLIRLIVPAILVPLLLAVSAVLVLFLVKLIGGFASTYVARILDNVTWRQIRRSALGNDTSSEIAAHASDRPHWLDESYVYLAPDLAEILSEHSNKIAVHSIGKFRGAISDLAFADTREGNPDVVSEYFTWKELVHASYFDVAEFRKLVVYGLTQSEGFKATDAFKADPDYSRVAGWYNKLQRHETPLAAISAQST